MKEYTITMNFLVEADDADYEKVSEFAEQLSENIMNYDKLIYKDDIEVVGITVHEVENHNPDDDNLYLNDDEDE